MSTDATTTPRRRLGRRLGAIALALLLALIDLALVAYLARGQWLGPAVRSTLRAQLPPDVELRFEAIDSDLVGRAACTGLELDAPGVSLRGAALAASFDAGALLDGDWSGLRAARLSADELVLQLPPYADEEHAAAPSLDRALSPWLDLLADGARLDVRSLRVTSAAGDELFAGPLSVSLAAGRSARHLQLIGSDAQAALAVHRDAAGRPTRVELSAELDAPIGLARQLGVDLPLQGGRLELVAHSVLVDGNIVERGRGRLTWTGGALRERGASSLRAEVELDGDQLRATGGLDVPGAQVLTHDLALPWPLDVGTGFDPTRLRGTFAIQVDDLEPWRTLLPDEVASRLPLRGRLRGAFDEDGLHVAGGQLRGDGLDLDVLDGRLPARAATDAPGRIDAILRLDAPLRREFDAPLGIVELVGAAHLVAEGSLDHPRLHGHLDLGPGRAGPLVWERVAGSLAIDERRLDLVAVEADGLRHREAEATTALRGDAAIELPADDAPLRLHVHGLATGRPTAAIAPLLPEEARDFACSAVAVDAALHFPTRATDGIPEGELELAIRDFAPSAEGTATRDTSSATLSLALAHTDQGPRAAVTMRGSASPRLLRLTGLDHALIDAAAVVPFRSRLTAHWDGCEDLRLAGELHLDRLSAGDLPEGSASLRGSFGRRELRIDAFALRGAIDADLHGTVRLDERPQPIDVAGFARIADAAVLQPLWPDAPTGAAGHLEILAQGPWTAPQLDLRAGVMLLDEALTRVLVGWPDELGPPPIGPLTAELRVRGRPDAAPTARGLLALGDPGGAELRLSLAGEAPVRLTAIGDDGPQLARGPGVIRGDLHLGATAHELGAGRLTAEWRWDATGLALERIELDAERGGLRGEAQIALPAEDLLRSEVLNAAQLSGRAELRALELGDVVADRLGLQTLSGRLTGEVTLGGRVVEPALRATLALDDARLKIANDVPSIDALRGRLQLAPGELTLQELRGTLGTGQVQLSGQLRSEEPGFAALADGELELRLTARDALLLRSTGMKLRSDAELRVHGRLDRGVQVEGEIAVSSAKLIRRMSLVPEFGRRGGVAAATGVRLPVVPAPFGARLRYDVLLRTEQPFELISHVVDMPLSAALQLRGSGDAPFLEGAITGSGGQLRLPALTMRIDRAVAAFDAQNPEHPKLAIRASARRLGIDLRAVATGRLDEVELVLSSLPPLTQSELYVLVTTGVLPEQLRQQGLGSRATLVGGYIANELLDFYFGSDSTEQGRSFAERFHFESGREISRNGVESLVVDFDLTDDFALRGERDVYEDFNMGVVYRIRF